MHNNKVLYRTLQSLGTASSSSVAPKKPLLPRFLHSMLLQAGVKKIDQKEESDDENELLLKSLTKFFPAQASISIAQLKQFPDIVNLLEENSIEEQDIVEMWATLVGAAETVSLQEAKEVVIMLRDIAWDPLDSAQFGEEYKKLVKSTNTKDSLLMFSKFVQWKDVQDMLEEEVVSMEELSDLWKRATKVSNLNGKINLPQFLKLNQWLDDLIDDKENGGSEDEMNDDYIDEDEEEEEEEEEGNNSGNDQEYYRGQFNIMVKKNSGKLPSLAQLYEWQEVQDMLEEQLVTKDKIKELYESVKTSKGEGMSFDEFVRFNELIDLFLDEVEKANKSSASSGKPASIEMNLMENEKGNLNEEERQLMELMDKADTMLISRSFQDFDSLIGDQDDPRLLTKPTSSVVAETAKTNQPSLDKLLQSLFKVCREQTRCGLDLFAKSESEEATGKSEEVSSQIRDLFQSVVETSKAAWVRELNSNSKLEKTIADKINGRWKMLYSNSEMFQFYNGVTGLVNVFPGSKFEGLELDFNTNNGYGYESQYLESIKVPLIGSLLGGINGKTSEAIVSANWELINEVSFMTNEKSLILRNYVNKVRFGPMEYEAQENWKSLRTMAMNEVVYIDDKYLLLRNAGALRIFFVLERV